MSAMKKSILFAILLFTPFVVSIAAAKKAVGHFEDVKGEISTRVSLGKAVMAKSDMKVYEGMRIKVKKDASLKIVFNDKSEVQLGPNTLFRVKKKSQNSSNTNLVLFEGLARVNAHKLKKSDTFAIKTPSAVAGVRGTYFDARVSRSAAINIKCYSTAGLGVVVRTPTGARTVGAGYSCVATSTGSIKMKKMARGVIVKTRTGGQKKKTKKADGKKGTTVKTKTVDAKAKTKDGAKSDAPQESGSDSKSEDNDSGTETNEPPPLGDETDMEDDFGGDDLELETQVGSGTEVSNIADEVNQDISDTVQAEADKEIVKETIEDNLRTLNIQFKIEDK
jgi:hypothetical protein